MMYNCQSEIISGLVLPLQGPPGGPSVPASHMHCCLEWLALTTVVDLAGQGLQSVSMSLYERYVPIGQAEKKNKVNALLSIFVKENFCRQ